MISGPLPGSGFEPIERVIAFSEKPAQHGALGSILVRPKLRLRKRPIAKRYRSLKNIKF